MWWDYGLWNLARVFFLSRNPKHTGNKKMESFEGPRTVGKRILFATRWYLSFTLETNITINTRAFNMQKRFKHGYVFANEILQHFLSLSRRSQGERRRKTIMKKNNYVCYPTRLVYP